MTQHADSIWERFPVLQTIPKEKFPKHIFIIPDGNGRWAKKYDKAIYEGHYQGYLALVRILDDLKDLPIDCVTIWGLSADNWKRSPEELDALMHIFDEAISQQIKKVVEDNSRFFHIGRRDRLPKSLVELIVESIKKTVDNPGHIVNLAIDFGGEDQELRVLEKAKDLAHDTKITEDILWSLRDGEGLIKHADLIIRTGGTRHISDVGWLHGAPTELYFVDKLFPNVTTEDILKAILDFSKRERRMGARFK